MGFRIGGDPTDAKRWQAFRSALDRLNVWSWQPHYPNPGVCDGTSWSVEIAYTDKAIVTGGRNCFPGVNGEPLGMGTDTKDRTFAKFCRAVTKLVGRKLH